MLDHVLAGERVVRFGKKEDAETTGARIITTLPFFAYLKIAEGCSNRCSYCAIPAIRGPYRSVPMEQVLEEAHWLAEHHVTELVVIAQDTTRYGCDLYGKCRLPELLRESLPHRRHPLGAGALQLSGAHHRGAAGRYGGRAAHGALSGYAHPALR